MISSILISLAYGETVFLCGAHQVECVLAETKDQLSSEILRRVEMENQVQTFKEQLDLHRNISQQVTHTRIHTPLSWKSNQL